MCRGLRVGGSGVMRPQKRPPAGKVAQKGSVFFSPKPRGAPGLAGARGGGFGFGRATCYAPVERVCRGRGMYARRIENLWEDRSLRCCAAESKLLCICYPRSHPTMHFCTNCNAAAYAYVPLRHCSAACVFRSCFAGFCVSECAVFKCDSGPVKGVNARAKACWRLCASARRGGHRLQEVRDAATSDLLVRRGPQHATRSRSWGRCGVRCSHVLAVRIPTRNSTCRATRGVSVTKSPSTSSTKTNSNSIR